MKTPTETTIVREVNQQAEYVRTFKRAGALIGSAGIGKSYACQWIAQNDRNVVYCSAANARTLSFKAATKALLAGFGHAVNFEHTDRLWDFVEDYAADLARDCGMLIFDEAHRLPLNFLLDVVDFPERYALPVMIVGNPALLMRTRINAGAMDQIASRCARTIALRQPVRDDFVAIAAEYDVIGQDAREAAARYGAASSIRDLVAMLQAARGFADRAPVRLAELRQAAAYLEKLPLLSAA